MLICLTSCNFVHTLAVPQNMYYPSRNTSLSRSYVFRQVLNTDKNSNVTFQNRTSEVETVIGD